MKIGKEVNWKEIISESAKLLRDNYYYYSDEMLNIEAELKINIGNNIPMKCISKGWTGKRVVFWTNQELKKIENYFCKKYEKLEEKQGDGDTLLVAAWISDELSKYCFISGLEKGVTILDTKYEDFMLDYIKDKNNIKMSKEETKNEAEDEKNNKGKKEEEK